ncbi:tRNA lysidine(34) synthetase TilS [Pelagibacterales bacterium SAG-MED01]|nr:tRNA lysidine(34) synthetase TilS [Pelagibacterales bacterium SAG-MED01]
MSRKNLSVVNKIPKLLNSKLKNKRISKIYREFEKTLSIKENFIVAVSGGPDSLALAFLSKIYSIKNKLVSRFFIIDHKLRNESTKEAELVKKILNKFSIKAEILTWHGKKPLKNLQASARKKRYELLIAKSKKLKINNLILGHHLDDLFENFFIRIIRGSGLKGLISLNQQTTINKTNLFRPLLNQKKDELIFLSKYVYNFFVKDPSNKDEKYLRIKIRNLIKELQNNGLDKKKFLLTINNLKSSDEVVKFYANENIKKNVCFSKTRNQVIINNNFFKQPQEIIFRSFSELIRKSGKKYYSVRGRKLDRIIRKIQTNNISKLTIGGCVIEKVNQTVILSKEH